MKDKIDPYLQPLYDALQDMIPAVKLKEYMETNVIQIAPLAFMRGRTLSDAVIILDEAQNTTTHQIKMFLTRLGMNAKNDRYRRYDADRFACVADFGVDTGDRF